MRIFPNRETAGAALAAALAGYRGRADVVVLALPRGGVPVARVVADALGAPLDVALVRKLGVPWQPELAFGAIGEGGARVLDTELIRACALTADQIARISEREQAELERRAHVFRAGREPVDVRQATVILVDDGLATGSTMLAAIRALRQRGAGEIVVAVPVGPKSTCQALRGEADEVVCLETPEPFEAVGQWYEDFHQLSDEEVIRLLSRPARPAGPA
jgi:predicted phosphoribosyltransferase